MLEWCEVSDRMVKGRTTTLTFNGGYTLQYNKLGLIFTDRKGNIRYMGYDLGRCEEVIKRVMADDIQAYDK